MGESIQESPPSSPKAPTMAMISGMPSRTTSPQGALTALELASLTFPRGKRMMKKPARNEYHNTGGHTVQRKLYNRNISQRRCQNNAWIQGPARFPDVPEPVVDIDKTLSAGRNHFRIGALQPVGHAFEHGGGKKQLLRAWAADRSKQEKNVSARLGR